MKFWEKHSEEMRKARLLQTAAVILAKFWRNNEGGMQFAVRDALALEAEIERQLKEKHS